ncbi:MAG: hypothetical protein WC889_14220, partial [Myxococcota bacterium]
MSIDGLGISLKKLAWVAIGAAVAVVLLAAGLKLFLRSDYLLGRLEREAESRLALMGVDAIVKPSGVGLDGAIRLHLVEVVRGGSGVVRLDRCTLRGVMGYLLRKKYDFYLTCKEGSLDLERLEQYRRDRPADSGASGKAKKREI